MNREIINSVSNLAALRSHAYSVSAGRIHIYNFLLPFWRNAFFSFAFERWVRIGEALKRILGRRKEHRVPKSISLSEWEISWKIFNFRLSSVTPVECLIQRVKTPSLDCFLNAWRLKRFCWHVKPHPRGDGQVERLKIRVPGWAPDEISYQIYGRHYFLPPIKGSAL